MLASPVGAHVESRPRRVRIFDGTVGSALAAGLTMAVVEYGLTLRRLHHPLAGTRQLLVLLVALYGLVAVPVGTLESAILGGLQATGAVALSRSLFGRVARDDRFDRVLAAAIVAGFVSLSAFAGWVALVAFELVAHTQRQWAGAVFTGAIAAFTLPLFALLGFPAHRVALRVVGWLPRRPPRTLTVLVLGAALGATFVIAYLERALDWREVHLGPLLGAALFLFLQGSWALVLFGPLGSLGRLGRARRPLFLSILAASLVLPLSALHGEQTKASVALLFQSHGARIVAVQVQKLFDRDRDGYSTLLGGGDCDDHDRAVHPGARDWPDDGVDQNCLGGDAHAHAPPAAPAPAEGAFHFRGNVLFLFLDTLRAQSLDERRMPHLAQLAQKSVRFTRAWSQAPNTARSFPSLVTSRLPSEIQWDDEFQEFPGILLSNRTLFEALHDAGYRTVGVASHFYFDKQGVHQGFDEFENGDAPPPAKAESDVSAPRVVARVERLLPRLEGQRFALMVHFAETHAKYLPHPEVRRGKKAPETSEEAYEEEATYLDGQVARLLEHLDDHTMVVVFSDHGEAFGLHQEYGEAITRHGRTLYEDLLHVPMFIYAPGLTPRTVDQPVMLMDLAPTVLDVLGVPLPSSFAGRSLAGALAGQPLAPAPAFAELLPRPNWDHAERALLDADGHSKAIYRFTNPRLEIYDLAVDPDEQTDLGETPLRARLEKQMAEWMDGVSAGRDGASVGAAPAQR